jgi:hypothetical protein
MRATRYDGRDGTLDILSPRAVSEPTLRPQVNESMMTRMRRSNTEIGNHHVHWSDKSRVILVPSRQDYQSRGFQHDLWWEQKDYEHFKVSAKDEVLRAMESQNLDLFSAMCKLYQPNCDSGEGSGSDVDDNGTDDDGTEGSIRSASSLSLDNFDANAKTSPAVALMKESLPSCTPSSRENLSRKASWGSVDSQSSGQSSERRAINFLEIRPERGPERGSEAGRMHHHRHTSASAEGTGGARTRPIHPLALMAL